MRILLVEDDEVLRNLLRRSLVERGHAVVPALSMEEAALQWQLPGIDAVLLDLTLPRTGGRQSGLGNGLTVLREARARGDRTPVLVLTARDRTEERIAGLDAGADDYLGKPFDTDEVEARLRSLVRRVRQADDDRAEIGELALDRRARRFFLAGQPWDLPAREFAILWELMTPPGRVVSKRELSHKLSEPNDVLRDNALEVFISSLRKRMTSNRVVIRTRRGLGYVLEEARPASGPVQP
jgi:two-component system, OmpR family, response regulator